MNRLPAIPPEETLQGQYAGFVSRFIAFFLDRAIIWTIILFINTTVIVVLGFFNIQIDQISTIQNNETTWQTILSVFFIFLTLLINFVLFYAYFILFWMLIGQTPGKMLMGVRIVSTNGGPISFFQAVRRIIGYWISAIVLFMGFLWVLISDTRQGWHDKFANTYVIYSWEARASYRFFKRLSHFADKRAQKYERTHPHTPIIVNGRIETNSEPTQESSAD